MRRRTMYLMRHIHTGIGIMNRISAAGITCTLVPLFIKIYINSRVQFHFLSKTYI